VSKCFSAQSQKLPSAAIFFSLAWLFSTPNFNSASVISEIKRLFIALPKDYLNRPWKDRGWNWLWVDLGKLAVGALIGAMVTMLMRPVNHTGSQITTQTQARAKSQPTQPKH
jgi:hypothetical protein